MAGVSAKSISVLNENGMSTKSFWARLVFLPFHQAMCRPLPVIAVCVSLSLFSGCAGLFSPSTPVLHKPSTCDLDAVLKLKFPQQIETLAGVPRTETIVENGINKLVGGRQPDQIKEWFDFKQGATEFKFIIFYSETAAIKEYQRDKDRHVFRESSENGLTGRVHYTEEPRADPEGGSVPMGYYISRADFRLHNIYIRVVTKARVEEGEKPQNDKLSNAVKELGQMLSKALSSGH